MALFPFCKPSSGLVRVTRRQLGLYCLLLFLFIYFLKGRKGTNPQAPPLLYHALGVDKERAVDGVAEAGTVGHPQETPWGAPLVWGDNHGSARRRAELAQRGVHTGLVVLAVGGYTRYLHRFLSSAEVHFLPGGRVTYYVLTDRPHSLEPGVKLGSERDLRVVPVTESPGWDRLAWRRMDLLAAAIKDPISSEVEYVFCADVDQLFVASVGEEILGDLVATLHPELYGMPRHAFPYAAEESSSACVEAGEGDYYYTSELYGGVAAEVYALARHCALLILKDQEAGVRARGMEESYLNRYLVDHRPSLVLSPEYSWWDSALVADVPVQRLVSLGRQCGALDVRKREEHSCLMDRKGDTLDML